MLTRNCTLLYVEDEPTAQEQMKMMLADNFRVFYQAFDGVEGLEIYKKHKPDIILSDVNMPLLDGLLMTEKIKKYDNKQIVILLSAFDERDVLLKAINIGVDYFITKPIDMDILNKRLEKIAQQIQNQKALEQIDKERVEALYQKAHYDMLTQLPNRYLFHLKLDEILSRSRRYNTTFTLLFIDLDAFKSINDSYGHAAGDASLTHLAKSVQKIVRREDLFARISGDEFALVAENITEIKEIENLVSKIMEAVSKPLIYKEKEIHLSCSIGISRYPKDALDKDELLVYADQAMYSAKKKGGAGYTYYTANPVV